jgi:hypothetical protein
MKIHLREIVCEDVRWMEDTKYRDPYNLMNAMIPTRPWATLLANQNSSDFEVSCNCLFHYIFRLINHNEVYNAGLSPLLC